MFGALPAHIPRLSKLARKKEIAARTDAKRLSSAAADALSTPGSPIDDAETAIRVLASRLTTDKAPLTENTRLPAGYAFFGQLVTHDLTFDPTTLGQRAPTTDQVGNFRTPRLDLDLLYGGGPQVTPHHYGRAASEVDPKSAALEPYFLYSETTIHDEPDLPRLANGRAVIPDPRNDSHLVISQLHLAFIRFHNRALRHAAARGAGGLDAFTEARRLTRWHYQWVVLNDYLKRLVGSNRRTLRALLKGDRGPRFFRWQGAPFVPLEFAAGAFRFGHSMLQPKYDLNAERTGVRLFDTTATESRDPKRAADLSGHRPLPRHSTIDWSRFVRFRDSEPQKSRIFSPQFPSAVTQLPASIFGEEGPSSLMERDLLRAWRLGLPSGQAVARAIGSRRSNTTGDDALYLYVIKEANTVGRGVQLGPVGATIVAEVLVGLLQADPSSYLSVSPTWTPELGTRGADFDLSDFLRYAEMPMSTGELPWERSAPSSGDDPSDGSNHRDLIARPSPPHPLAPA